MKISIIGNGYVGTTVGKGFIELGNKVIFYDVVDKDLLNYDFTKDINYTIENSDISFVCVPTPTNENGEIDLSYINDVSKNIGKAIAKKDKYHLVVIKSTVVPNTTEYVVIPSLEYYSNRKAGDGFGVCMNPEFITEKVNTLIKRDFFTDDRIVIGEYDKRSGDILEELYRSLNIPVFRVSLQTAEMIKYASNCMLVTKISYWNEIFLICNKLGVDFQTVADIVGLDERIGKYGTITGKAFGCKCLPKDLKAFISFSKMYHKTKLLRAIDDINEEMKRGYGIRE